jgi:hypothetical protein
MWNAIEFEHHPGFMSTTSNNVIFYGIRFSDITQAAQFLKDVDARAGTYKGWNINGTCGLLWVEKNIYFVDNVWISRNEFKIKFNLNWKW